MPRAVSRPEITQLAFDSLATVADDTQAETGAERTNGAVPLPDAQPFSGTRQQYVLMPGGFQYTLDALLAQPVQEGVADAAGQAERHPIYEQSVSTRPHFDALAHLPPEDGSGDGAGEPAGRGGERNGSAVHRADVYAGRGAGDGLRGSQRDSDRPVSFAGRSGRVRPDEPEPAAPP